MKIARSLFMFLFICFVYIDLICAKQIEDIPTCLNDTECDETLESDIFTENTIKEDNSVSREFNTTTENNDNISTSSSTLHISESTSLAPSTTVAPPKTPNLSNRTRNHNIHKIDSTVCDCDLTTSTCDINCCCDKDCNEFHLTVFSHCQDHHAELYDSRYCYNVNFIDRNNTPFTLEKLAGNLFCILYDNLPPSYTDNSDLVIKNEKDLRAAIRSKKLTWKWEDQLFVPEYKISNPYQDGDIIWRLYKTYIQPFELLQSGFNGLCSFKKTLKYLREWKDSCLQIDLNSANKYLFPNAFNNFTVIRSPHLLNETYVGLSEQTCPRTTCLRFTNHYCKNSWNNCKTFNVAGFCSNGTCYNVATSIRYLIIHNGSMGINNIHAYFKLSNVSHNFYQYFEVLYEWTDLNKNKSFALSGNPGYIFGKPILIGTLKINKTDKTENRYISFNRTDSFLTLPLAEKGGECSKFDRYVVSFGEDVKVRCKISLKTSNFSTSSCIKLQNRTTSLLMKDSLFNVTQTDQYTIYVSKSGNFTKNDTSNWAQILLDRVPQNVITGQLINDRVHCSGLVTSMHLKVLYSTLPKPETLTNYKILGVGITFSDEIDISWQKCLTENCTDSLTVDVISYVTFYDVSKPSKYYFVGGPNLDITLPYDFFYPFLSSAAYTTRSVHLILLTTMICTHYFVTITWLLY